LKIDDKITTHPKWLTLTLEAKSLWFHAAVWCAAHNNDGHVPDDAMPLIAFTGSIPAHMIDDSTARLVKARMWARRPKAKGSGFEIVNWLDYQPSRQQVKERGEADERRAEMRRLHAWLHKKKTGKLVKGIIDRRDGMHCRYCGELTIVTQGDRRSAQRRTYDLLDPESRWDTEATAMHDDELATIAALWVVSCGWCNAVKGSRTPAEADMELLEPPGQRRLRDLSLSVANRSGTVPVLGTGLSGPDLAGPGRVDPGAGLHPTVMVVPDPVPPPDDHDYPHEGEAS
jgi:hypothetical protein